jgi:hypothetical protein
MIAIFNLFLYVLYYSKGFTMKRYILLIFVISLLTSCNTNNDKNDSNSTLITLIALSSSSTTTTTTTTPTCTGTKSFTDVQANSTYSTCTSCHSSLSHSSGYDFSTYSNAVNSNGGNQVVAGSPSTSRLWKKVNTGGSMNDRTTTAFNEIIYCWIQSGASQ